MVVTLSVAVGTASGVLALSKAAWKLEISISNLDQGTRIVDTTVKNLAGEVKSLGNECDLVYTGLEEAIARSENGSRPLNDVDCRMWECLGMQVEETSRTMEELELFVNSVRGEESIFIGQAQRQKKLDKSKDQIASIRTKVWRHTDNLRTTLLLINTILAHIAPRRVDRNHVKELEKLQGVVEKLQRLSDPNSVSRPTHTEAILLQCVCEVIVKETTLYEASLVADSITDCRGATNSNIRVAEWVSTLESIRRDDRLSQPPDIVFNVSPNVPRNERWTVVTSATSEQRAVRESEDVQWAGYDSDDDLDTDLARAALDTGTKAFEAQEWEEADSLLQEALRVLQRLPKQQRAFCDIFDLQYKLAVCAYHTREPGDAEEALISLVQQSASSDEQHRCIYDAVHLLSHLHIRMGQIDRARSECEKAVQARRRLLGKQSDASLESTALMAHIYVLLNNRARAKLWLAMIPEERRDAVLQTVEESLGTKAEEHLDSSSLRARSISDSDLRGKRFQSTFSPSSLAPSMENRCYGPVSSIISQSPAASLWQSHQHTPSNKVGLEDLQSTTVTSLSSAEERRASSTAEKERVNEDHFAYPQARGTAALSPGEPPEATKTFNGKALSRKEILDKIGCQPRDQIEDAVCDGDHSTLAKLLNRKRDSWRSKLRKRVRPERVTALHFAALFGEIDMARLLLDCRFNINEVPFGYSTSITPLKFAIGARQVDMVDFLLANGAKPSEPDSWSTLAGQVMNRSWLMKTMSEAEKDHVPNRIIAILRILLKHGWNINAPFETSGATVLHQAVGFWTGSYRLDLNLRTAVTAFLCEHGADPFQANAEGKTPYDMASGSGHHDLLLILGRGSKRKFPSDGPVAPVELPSELST